MQAPLQGVYHPRDPKSSDFYACVEDNFEELERVWDDKYQKQHGFWRPVIHDVIYNYLDCGDLHLGFARVLCSSCHLEFLLPYSCKGRYFCPSCHQKRVIAFAQRVETELLEKVPHSQYVVAIPKMLRVYFKHDRKLLGLLSQCFYQSLAEFFRAATEHQDAVPGVIISIQTYGRDPFPFHPHLHCLVSDGCFSRNGQFHPIPWVDTEKLMQLFRHKLFQELLARDLITSTTVDLLLSWRHPGFSVFRGEPVQPDHCAARERLVRYLLHPSFALDRLHYDSDTGTVIYHPAKNRSDRHSNSDSPTTSSALDWLAAVVTHIPDKGQQLLRYYGRYSNVRQAEKKSPTAAGQELHITLSSPEQDSEFRRQCRANWARLIKKIFQVDPLECPRCHGPMRIISFIEDPAVIKKILQHLKLWEVPKRSPPAKPPPRDFVYDSNFFDGLTN